MTKVVKVTDDMIEFDNGWQLLSEHNQDCCEHHYLSFGDLKLDDFDGLEFNLESNFFTRVDGYGIRLNPVTGFPVSIPGYGYNNGYYSSNLILVLTNGSETKSFDISDCQEISG